MRILVVDDELVSREKALTILSQYGECDTAATGNEALEYFVKAHEGGRPYRYITMDIEMPDMSGIEVLKSIRRYEEFFQIPLGTGVKVLMLSAKSDSASILPSFKEGCEAYIVKPFTTDKLVKALFDI